MTVTDENTPSHGGAQTSTGQPSTPDAAQGAAPDTANADQAPAESPAESPTASKWGSAANDRIAELEVENAGLKDRLIRALADVENIRKRSEREVRDAGQYAIAKFAGDMLSVADNLRRALDATPADAIAGDAALKTLADGVGMTERELLNALEKHGVRRIEPKGEKFDPNLHQAMFEVPNPDVPSGMVAEVVQAGFTIGERVLRPALVGVSKGGPRPAPAAEHKTSGDAGGVADAGDRIDKTA